MGIVSQVYRQCDGVPRVCCGIVTRLTFFFEWVGSFFFFIALDAIRYVYNLRNYKQKKQKKKKIWEQFKITILKMWSDTLEWEFNLQDDVDMICYRLTNFAF